MLQAELKVENNTVYLVLDHDKGRTVLMLVKKDYEELPTFRFADGASIGALHDYLRDQVIEGEIAR